MAEKVIIEERTIVKHSNILARASWSPDSVWEARVVAIVAAQVRSDRDGFHEYEIPVKDLLGVVGKASSGQAYRDLSRLARKMVSRVLEIQDGNDSRRSWRKYPLFSKCAYTKGDKKLIVRFDPDLKPHYLDLKKHFTRYSLTEYLSLPSIYSQRIYEILRSWDDRLSCEFNIDELHRILCTPPSFRKTFGLLRCRVLEPAHRDINSLTQLEYEWEAVTKSGAPPKKGRPVVRVRFVMGKKTRAKIRAKKRKETNAKQSAKNNRMVLSVARCHHQPIVDGECIHADDSEGCEFCRSLVKDRPEK